LHYRNNANVRRNEARNFASRLEPPLPSRRPIGEWDEMVRHAIGKRLGTFRQTAVLLNAQEDVVLR
jgi:hypothetical protein